MIAILQARMSSSRLPGKVLFPIIGKPMLLRQIERIKRSKLIDYLIVATSTHSSDDEIYDICENEGIYCFRGDLNDVLDRFYHAAKTYSSHPDHIIRLTGDCPLIAPEIVDRTIQFYLDGDYDYVSNCLEPTFPDGLDVEVFKFHCLEQAWKEAKLPSQREHVTPFIYQHPDRYKIGCYKNSNDLSYYRWTVDEKDDYELVKKIYEELYPSNPEFKMNDILELFERKPELRNYNSMYERNEGYKKSLLKDMELVNRREIK
jgi:spore coat polysaccharide biosynthesis protein SpsF